MPQFVKVASLMPDQHRCNLRLRVLSVESISETIQAETGKIIQSAEAIVGDDTACILLNLKNEQVNLLSRNARLQILNGHVRMHRGFMRLEVDEEEGDDANTEDSRPSITAVPEDDVDDELESMLTCDGDKFGYQISSPSSSSSTLSLVNSSSNSSLSSSPITSNNLSSSPYHTPSIFDDEHHIEPSSPQTRPEDISSSSPSLSTTSLSSATSSPSTHSHSSSRDPMEIEMRLGTGGSVPLVEYYRTLAFDYVATVEPVGR